MTQDEAFLRAILEDPGDDTLRLIFADALEEHGGGARAEFIRCQVQLAQWACTENCEQYERERIAHRKCDGCQRRGPESPLRRHHDGAACGCKRCLLRARERDLLRQYGVPWLFKELKATCDLTSLPQLVLRWLDVECLGAEGAVVAFRRGFVAVIALPTQVFLDHVAELFRAAPIEEVRLSGEQPRQLSDGWGWWHDGRAPKLLHYMLFPLGVWKSRELALHALSYHYIAYGRKLAGLPPLTRAAHG